jgi:hypothetical protein
VDALFADSIVIGGQQVVKGNSRFAVPKKQTTRKSLEDAGRNDLEMRRLELLTPYMRSKCSTS